MAIVAALALVAAVLGCGALRAETAANASPPEVAAASANPLSNPMHPDHESVPVRRLGVGSTVNDDNAFKSAALKRNRGSTFALSTPRQSGSSTPPTLGIIWSQQRVDTPVRALASSPMGQNLLIQFCVARC
ncbi:hypothetical protein [Mycobacterium sp. 852002-10029_SCH5224772]|uniref:hypothetical protein n=1 Tax=Mycobacterium sp. 852002-10029_SCH5224772 TaxID=1834083 RepID=UPI001E3A2ACD|nr:hypothetical protein [Mycobacterium sp. 852002-10029_SCH5224772]